VVSVLAGILAFMLLTADSCNGGGATSSPKGGPVAVTDSTFTAAAFQGQPFEAFKLTLTNKGTGDIKIIGLDLSQGPDHFLDHNTILQAKGCAIDKNVVHGLSCGLIAAGASMPITVVAQARDQGNFEYHLIVVDASNGFGSFVPEVDGQEVYYHWQVTVIAGG
jgi:hypothetical protein